MVVWMIHNVTETKLAMRRLEEQQDALEMQQAKLERLARTDSLTGLLNRRSFFDEASTELRWVQRTGSPAVVISFDLDDFKTINDTRDTRPATRCCGPSATCCAPSGGPPTSSAVSVARSSRSWSAAPT